MPQKVFPDDVVELLCGVMSCDPLEETVPDVVLVRFRIESWGAAENLATISNRRAVWPEETGRELELVGRLVVDPKQDRPEIGYPGLVARGISGYVECKSRPVRAGH